MRISLFHRIFTDPCPLWGSSFFFWFCRYFTNVATRRDGRASAECRFESSIKGSNSQSALKDKEMPENSVSKEKIYASLLSEAILSEQNDWTTTSSRSNLKQFLLTSNLCMKEDSMKCTPQRIFWLKPSQTFPRLWFYFWKAISII